MVISSDPLEEGKRMRLSIDLTEQQHADLTSAAAEQGKSITEYLLELAFGANGAAGGENAPEGASSINMPLGKSGHGSRASQSVEDIFEDMMRSPE
jgi:hypothetical protein